MLIIRRIKSFFSCLSIYQVKFLWSLFGFFMMIVLMFASQFFGFAEIIPTAYAMTAIEDSLDEPIPLESMDEEDTFSTQSSESNFYEEIYDDSLPNPENPTLLPGWPNKETAKTTGLLVGILLGLAASTYFLVLSPYSGFNCTAFRHTSSLIDGFIDNFR